MTSKFVEAVRCSNHIVTVVNNTLQHCYLCFRLNNIVSICGQCMLGSCDILKKIDISISKKIDNMDYNHNIKKQQKFYSLPKRYNKIRAKALCRELVITLMSDVHVLWQRTWLILCMSAYVGTCWRVIIFYNSPGSETIERYDFGELCHKTFVCCSNHYITRR